MKIVLTQDDTKIMILRALAAEGMISPNVNYEVEISTYSVDFIVVTANGESSANDAVPKRAKDEAITSEGDI